MSIIKKNKELFILIGIILILALCIELPSWLQGGYFVGGGDIKTQWYPFYVLNRRETVNAIKNSTFPFYSWVLFLGNNIWASKTSYGFVDIFNLIFYICKQNYFWIYDVQIILKLLTAGITFYLFISYAFNNKKAGLLGGLLYASSSYLMYFTSQSGFLSFVALAPLYLLGIVKCIKENKKILFILSTTILFLVNYYMFFSLTVLSPFIYIYCYYNINGELKGVVPNILKIILYYVIGFLISSVFTIPSFLFILQNERVGGLTNNIFGYSNIKVYLNILYSLFSPSQLSIYGNNIFDFNEHTLKELCLFSSCLVTILTINLFFIKKSKFKKSSILLLCFMIVIMLLPLLGSVLNGFSEVCFRWTYLFITFEIVITTYLLFVNTSINTKNILIASIISSSLIIISFVLGIVYESASFSDYYVQIRIIIFVIVLMFVYYACFVFNKKLIYVVLCVELIVYSILCGYRNTNLTVSDDDIEKVNSVLADLDGENLKDHLLYIEDNEGVFFRTYIDYEDLYWQFSRNMNILYNIEGVMSYDSTYEPSFSDMLNINEDGVVKDIYWEYSIEDPDLLDFVSCKYALTLKEDRIPFNNYEIIEADYRGGIIISKNLDYQPFGITYTNRIADTNSFKDLKKSIISNNEEIDKYLLSSTNSELTDVYYYNNQLEGKITSDNTSFAVLKLSYDDGINVVVNDKKVNIYKCNGGMIGFPIEKGNNNVEITFTPKGFKLGFIFSLIGFLLFIAILFEKKIIGLLNKQHN